jgi:hypothetical protein
VPDGHKTVTPWHAAVRPARYAVRASPGSPGFGDSGSSHPPPQSRHDHTIDAGNVPRAGPRGRFTRHARCVLPQVAHATTGRSRAVDSCDSIDSIA